MVGTEGSVDARTQLKTQRLQGGVQGSETMSHFQKLEPNTYVPLGKPFTRSLAGIPFAKTAEGGQLRDAVKGALERLQANGTYDALIQKYGLPEQRAEADFGQSGRVRAAAKKVAIAGQDSRRGWRGMPAASGVAAGAGLP